MRFTQVLAAVICCFAIASSSQAQESATPPPALRVDAGDFNSLQAAFDALPESGGIVTIPPGNYDISEPLRIKTPETRISGSGASTHIRNLNQDGEPALILEPANIAEDSKARLWRVQVDNLRISGNEKSGDGVRATGIQEIYFHGVSIDHHGGNGLGMTDCSEDPRIADCILTYNKKAGIFIDSGHDIVVSANHFEENQDALICIDGYNLTFTGNNIDDHLGNGVVVENTYGSVISGNMIEECNGTAIILDRDCYGITISANVIAHDMGGGIDLRDANGCAISANTFVLVHEFAVRVAGKSGRVTITGNNFSNSHIGSDAPKRPVEHKNAISRDAGHGVLLEGSQHVVISGNMFSGLDKVAVESRGACQAISVTGNVITDINRRTDTPDQAAIDLSSETTASIVKDNLVDTE